MRPVVLCFVAHPDDETIGAGATLAHLAADHDVYVVAFADGVGSRYLDADVAHAAAARQRAQQFTDACELLGCAGAWIAPAFADQESDMVSQLSINRAVEAQLRTWQDREIVLVVTHHPGDLNLDHRRVSEAVLVATRHLVCPIWLMAPEYPSRAQGWAPTRYVPAVAPKRSALECYRQEVRPAPHSRSIEALCGPGVVERFQVLR